MEQVTGRPFVRELDRRILRPLNLRRTALSEDPSTAWAWSEGGLTSTAADLDAFLRALLDGRLLPPAQQRHLFEVPAVPGAAENTGCPTPAACFSAGGLMGIELNGTKVWGKTGSSGGWTSGVFASTEQHRRTAYTLRPGTPAPPPPHSSAPVSRQWSRRPSPTSQGPADTDPRAHAPRAGRSAGSVRAAVELVRQRAVGGPSGHRVLVACTEPRGKIGDRVPGFPSGGRGSRVAGGNATTGPRGTVAQRAPAFQGRAFRCPAARAVCRAQATMGSWSGRRP